MAKKKNSKAIAPSHLSGSGNLKLASISDRVPDTALYPAFSLRYIQDKYCISKCQRDDKAAFADKIRVLSTLTWNEIACQPRHKNGYEPIPRYIIKADLPKIVTEDTNLLAFRWSGLKPMVGFRDRHIFYILWFDRDRTLYPH